MTAKCNAIEKKELNDFQRATRIRAESIVWDWNPIWHVINQNAKIFATLPLPPRGHVSQKTNRL